MTTTQIADALEPGIFFGIPFEEYASWKAWNPTLVKVMLKDSARAMRYTMIHGGESSDAMDLGRAEHCCVLEPVRTAEAYAIMPPFELDEANVTGDGNRSKHKTTRYYKDRRDAFAAANIGKEIIEKADYDRCIAMRRAIFAHESAPKLLEGFGHAEASIVWKDPGTGLLCKGRIDWLQLELRRLVDLKTAANPQPWAFLNQVAKLFYHVSIAAYIDGLKALGHQIDSAHFITVGNRPWHDVIRYEIEDSMIRHGRREWHSALQRVRWCLKHDKWPGFCDEPYPAELPNWAVPEDEADAVSVGGKAAFDRS